MKSSDLFCLRLVVILFRRSVPPSVTPDVKGTSVVATVGNEPRSIKIIQFIHIIDFDELSWRNVSVSQRGVSFSVDIMNRCQSNCCLRCCIIHDQVEMGLAINKSIEQQ